MSAYEVIGRVRKYWYKSSLDPSIASPEATEDENYDDDFDALVEPTERYPANCVSSLLSNGKHSPTLDIDVPMSVVPSSTPGHYHLLFPTLELTWPDYLRLLTTLAEFGIVEPGYVTAAENREQSLLRLRHNKHGALCDVCFDRGVISVNTEDHIPNIAIVPCPSSTCDSNEEGCN